MLEQSVSQTATAKKPCTKNCAWRHPATRFVDDRDCLAAYLALETSEVLAGVKPANLVQINDKTQACGRNLLQLWRQYGYELVVGSGLTTAILRETEHLALILFYREETLEKRLSGRSARAFLRRAGYPEPDNFEQTLRQLAGSFDQVLIPHEIGLFLGYPLKDVAAFMGWTALPVTCQRLWKIYGNPRRSLRLAATYRAIREQMLARLTRTCHPRSLLRAGAACS